MINVKDLTAAQKHTMICGIYSGAGYKSDSTCDHCHGAGYEISKHCNDIECSCGNIHTEIRTCPNECEPVEYTEAETAGNEFLKDCQEELDKAIKDGEL